MSSAAVSGLALAGHKTAAAIGPLRSVPPPHEAVLPLDQHMGVPARPCVRVHDRVRVGSCIAEAADGISAALHAPVAGRVIAIEPRPAPHTIGMETPAIVIENDGSDEAAEPLIGPGTALELPPLELRAAIRAAGIVGLGGAAFPTDVKLRAGPERRIHTLVINGAECEPYISCDQAVLEQRTAAVLEGAAVMLHALEAQRCFVAVEADKVQVVQALETALRRAADPRFVLRLLRPVYPAGAERQLITLLTGLEVPSDGVPADIGIVCQNVGTALAVDELASSGAPLTHRVVTVTGQGVATPANVEARLGTPLSALIDFCGGYTTQVTRLIMGGSMMGISLPHDELPVVKATNCLIAAGPADLETRGAEMPCIRCGECAAICPAALLPQQLHWHAEAGDVDALEALGLDDCIECGCCDYVCPSQIPLTSRFQSAKRLLRTHDRAHTRADRARARYEARTARIEAQEEEQRRRLEEKRRAAIRRP